MTGADIGVLVAILGLIVLAGFLALAETSLTRMNRIKAQTLADQGRRGAGLLTSLVEHPERFLNPVLLLLLVCHIVASILVGILFEQYGAWGIVIATFIEVVVIFVLAEAAPKTWAVQHPERAALLAAPIVAAIVNFPPIRLLARLLIGLSNVILPGKGLQSGPFVSEEELLATVDVATEDETIEHEERALIRSIIEFGDTVAREVMVPRPDMVAVEGRDRVSDVLEVAIAAGFSRIPVYDQGIDDVIGIVYTKDLMRTMREDERGDRTARDVARKAEFVPEGKKVAELMREMQKDKFHIAIVVDEYGGTAGLVTLEDLIEELVGEIVDEFDVEEPSIEALTGGAYRVNARMPLDEVNELVAADFPEGDWDTIGGFVFNLLGHVPTEGEGVEHDGYRLVAEKVQGRRIGRVRILRVPAPVPSSDESS
ncbi:MAG TPA: hemolysin family protein [Acidimicrobiales bacterium]|nr:hemolysin family protein [Acidimicrobiales bacterium]